MPTFERAGTTIYYEEHGRGFPMLLIAPGGMNSAVPMWDRAAINPVRQEFFGAARPASTLIEVSRLALPDMKVEIEAVVGLPKAD